MSRITVPDEILMQVEKPARYIGNELNMVKKDPESVDIRFECRVWDCKYYTSF